MKKVFEIMYDINISPKSSNKFFKKMYLWNEKKYLSFINMTHIMLYENKSISSEFTMTYYSQQHLPNGKSLGLFENDQKC